jgi:hypothetical protein
MGSTEFDIPSLYWKLLGEFNFYVCQFIITTLSTKPRLDGVATQKTMTWIFLAVKMSDLRLYQFSEKCFIVQKICTWHSIDLIEIYSFY